MAGQTLLVIFLFACAGNTIRCAEVSVEQLVRAMTKDSFRGNMADKNIFEVNATGAWGRNLSSLIGKGRSALPALLKLLDDTDAAVVLAAAEGILAIGGPDEKAKACTALEQVRGKLGEDNLAGAIFLQVQMSGRIPESAKWESMPGNSRILLLVFLTQNPVPGLEKSIVSLLTFEKSGTRGYAAAFLAEHGSPEAARIARERLRSETHNFPFIQLQNIILRKGSMDDCRQLLINILKTGGSADVELALNTIVRLKAESLFPALYDAMQRLNSGERGRVQYVGPLLQMGTSGAMDFALRMVRDSSPQVRSQAAQILGSSNDDKVVDALNELVDDDVAWVRAFALYSLARMSINSKSADTVLREVELRCVWTWQEKKMLLIGYCASKQIDRAKAFFMQHAGSNQEIWNVLNEAAKDLNDRDACTLQANEAFADWLQLAHMDAANVYRIHLAFSAAGDGRINAPLLALARSMPVREGAFSPLDSTPLQVFADARWKDLPNGEKELAALLEDESISTRVAAADCLGETGSASALPMLERAALDPAFADGQFYSISRVEVWFRGLPIQPGWYPVRVAARYAIDRIKSRGGASGTKTVMVGSSVAKQAVLPIVPADQPKAEGRKVIFTMDFNKPNWGSISNRRGELIPDPTSGNGMVLSANLLYEVSNAYLGASAHTELPTGTTYVIGPNTYFETEVYYEGKADPAASLDLTGKRGDQKIVGRLMLGELKPKTWQRVSVQVAEDKMVAYWKREKDLPKNGDQFSIIQFNADLDRKRGIEKLLFRNLVIYEQSAKK